MKKITLIILSFVFGMTLYAQDSSIFDKFEDFDDVTTVVVTQQAFKMLQKVSSDSKEGKEFQKLVSGLKDLKIFTTDNPEIAAEMRNTFEKYLRANKLSELMRIKDKDANVKIYIREGKDEDHVSEFLMIVDEMSIRPNIKSDRGTPEVVIISLTGDIDLKNISKITTKMNIPAGEYIEKAEKK